MAIGQGFVLATPLQMVNAYAAIANGGTLYQPYLVKEILDADGNVVKVNDPKIIRKLAVDPQFMALIQEGLRDVIAWEAGTAHDTFDVPGIIASGKTGTAEFCDRYPQCLDRDGRVKTSHAWFVSYAPSNNPTIVTVVFVYGGGGVTLEGSEVAVPVTNKILRYYFNIKDEEEAEPEETEEPLPAILPEDTFTTRLLGTDSWSSEKASVSGFVLDSRGQGVPDVLVDVLANGQSVAQIKSGLTGQFDYTELDPNLAATWELRLPDYPGAPPLELEIGNGLRYLIEFKAQPAVNAPLAAQ
jgi:membrane peptidoglycan carboxypeptidase